MRWYETEYGFAPYSGGAGYTPYNGYGLNGGLGGGGSFVAPNVGGFNEPFSFFPFGQNIGLQLYPFIPQFIFDELPLLPSVPPVDLTGTDAPQIENAYMGFPGGSFGITDPVAFLSDVSKKFAIIMFALMLLGLGLIFLLKSTDTGKAALSGATKGVL